VLGIFANLANMKHWAHAPASFVGFDIFSPEKTGKAACIRAIEENAAYTSKGHIEIISRETGRVPMIIRMMGGASKGFLWPQIVSNALGVPLEIPKAADSTYLGAAICGMVATGEFKNWDEAVDRLVRIERAIDPDLKESAKYDVLFDQWLKVYEKMLVISEEGLLPPMWRAAGV
jgi:autoinducer 2 (AI-2) kinase